MLLFFFLFFFREGHLGHGRLKGSVPGRLACFAPGRPNPNPPGGAGCLRNCHAGATSLPPELYPRSSNLYRTPPLAISLKDPALAPLAAYSLGNALALLPSDWAVKFHTHHPLPPKIAQRFKVSPGGGECMAVEAQPVGDHEVVGQHACLRARGVSSPLPTYPSSPPPTSPFSFLLSAICKDDIASGRLEHINLK